MRHRVLLVGLWVPVALMTLAVRGEARRPSLLPSQQVVNARGKEIDLGLFPTGIAVSSDGRLMLVTNNGFLFQSIMAVDLETLTTKETQIGATGGNVLFIGVALSPDGRTGYASGHTDVGFQDVLYTVTIGPGPTMTRGESVIMPRGSFPAGLAMSADGRRLYVAENLGNALGVVDTQRRERIAGVPLGRQPWAVALHPSLPQAYVTNRVDNTVSIVDIEQLTVVATVPTGNGPNAVAVSPDGGKIFVANASTDDLTVFDVNQPQSVRRISLRPFPDAKPGSSPNALAFAPDGTRLYVANAWDNALAVVAPQTEQVVGRVVADHWPSA